jgi:D-alanyl-D-alanine carboxypeptidase
MRAAATAARRKRGVALLFAVVCAVVLLVALVPRMLPGAAGDAVRPAAGDPVERPPVVQSLPVPRFASEPQSGGICADEAVQAALATGDDEGVVAASGGGEAFRAAVAGGRAPCISLTDAGRRWVVVNKLRPLEPIDAAPSPLVAPTVRSLSGGDLRADAAEGLSALAAGAKAAGAGEVAMLSGYRSYTTQQSTYAQHVGADGQQVADLESARAGYSEHQTGITLDLVACAGGCGGLDDFAGTAQGRWVADHAWEYGFIVRYEDGATGITGYKAEPWHLRFVGPALARAYHDGGWHSLEEFFGLPAAPEYAD